ncbi:MAG: NAD(P)H-quinone oxidoreductase [Dehalococcoidia bacterium]|nr:NAD(P)H-quinone oxidoreductase [Dehalococcoidia bacterium]
MRAVVVPAPGGADVLQVQDIPAPKCGPDDLLVRVRAAALNRADILQRQGRYPQPGPRPPFEVPGLEFAGEVIEIGDRVEGFALGERVMGLLAGGGQAEQVVIHHRQAMKVPANLSWTEAGALPEVYITAHDAFRQAGLVSGETVLIHAAGSGVGVAAIQIAKAMGAATIIGTAGSDAKIERARELGLTFGVNYREQPDFAEAVLAATDGRGADVILDAIGGDYWERNLRSLATKGRMVIIGLMGGAKVDSGLALLLQRRATVIGTTLRARSLEEKAIATRAFEKSVLPHIAAGRVRVIVDRTYPLDDISAAHLYLESNENFGKVVLEI